jgi:hypothetical protein
MYDIFNPKNCYLFLGDMIRDVHPGFGFFSIPIPDVRVKKHEIFLKCGPDTQSPHSVQYTLLKFSKYFPDFHCVAIFSTTLINTSSISDYF